MKFSHFYPFGKVVATDKRPCFLPIFELILILTGLRADACFAAPPDNAKFVTYFLATDKKG